METKETAIPAPAARLYERTWMLQPDVKFGSGTDDAVVLQGLPRQLSWNAEMDGQDDVFSATCK
jgi:hypothetical protein